MNQATFNLTVNAPFPTLLPTGTTSHMRTNIRYCKSRAPSLSTEIEEDSLCRNLKINVLFLCKGCLKIGGAKILDNYMQIGR